MHEMEYKIRNNKNLSQKKKEAKITKIKEEQLWGVEYDANMMLHGDGKSHIPRGDFFRKLSLQEKRNQKYLIKFLKG